MDLDTDFKRRQLALQQANPSLRSAATATPNVLAPITSANLPAPVRQVATVQQPVQQVQAQPQQKAGFTFKQRADKGFDFYDPNGAKTTIENYTKNTGVNGSDLRIGMAQAGDAQSQKIVNTPQQTPQPEKKDTSFLGFLKSIPGSAQKFAEGVGNVLNPIPSIIDFFKQSEVAQKTGGSGALLDPQLVQNQIDYLNSEVGKALTRQEADQMIADLQDKSRTANTKQDAAEKEVGVTADQSAGAMAGFDTIALITGLPGILKHIAEQGGKATTDTVVSEFEKSTGKKLSDDQVAVINDQLKTPQTAQQLPTQDLDAIREAGAKVPSTLDNVAVKQADTLPNEDLQAIQQAGGQVPTSTIADALPGSKLTDVADTVFHLPGSGYTKISKQEAEYLKNEVDNIPWSKDDRPHLTAGQKVLDKEKELTREEFSNLSPNAKQALENATKQDEVIRAQTGDAGVIDEAGKTTSPDVAQADISAKAVDDANIAAKAAEPADIASEANSGIQGEQKLLNSVTDTTKASKEGPGFLRADQAHPQIDNITKRLTQIDHQLTRVAEGKKTLSREQITSLKAERDGLIKQANEPFTPEGVQPTKPTPAPGKQSNKTPTAEEAFPDATPEDKKAIQDIMDQLSPAEREFNKKQKTTGQQKAARITKAEKSYESAGGGEEGFRAKLSGLKGKYQESGYTPISVDPKVEKTLLDHIEKSDLRAFEKLNTQNALRKVWGANPEKPTGADVAYIRKFFNKQYGEGTGDELADGIASALKEGQSLEDIASNVAGLPRALMATGDLSGGFRQALPLGTRFPKEWAAANAESVKYALNPKYFEKEMKRLSNTDEYATITDKMGVDLPGISGIQDEGFIGAGYAEKIPIAKIGIKAADRAYTGVLTKLRYDVASKLIEKSGGVDSFLQGFKSTYGDEAVRKGLFGGKMVSKEDRALKALGEVINTFTGRGGMKGGLLDEHMKTASTLLFAPRLWAANLQRLNPAFYGRLLRDNPQAAKLALQSQGTFFAVNGTVLGLAAAAGASVGMDPRSADFGKIKVGNTRYDILGGQQQNAVLLARLFTGEKVNSETGEVTKLGQGYGSKSRTDLLTDMFNNKSNPLLAYGLRLLNASPDENGNLKDEFGKDYNPITDAVGLVTPLGVQGTVETINDTGSIPQGILMNVPSFFGVGTQTYGNVATKDKYVDPNGKISFKGKVDPDMVTGPDGNALLDSKGNIVRIKIDKNSTPAEIEALKSEKAQSTIRDNFVQGQSKEDQALMKLSDDELTSFVKKGTITQDKADKISSLNAQADAGGKLPPSEITSDVAKSFYKTWDSKSKKEQDDWLNAEPDDNAKAVADQVNQQRTVGLDEFKPSNKLSKLYAEYEKDILGHPEYTDIDKQNKARSFQVDAAKSGYTSQQTDVYNEGSSDDTELLIENGKISKADLDEAIKLDNQLYSSGLTNSMKFNKKFRAKYGYGNPDGTSGDGSDGSGSINIAASLPSKSSGSGSEKPEFSSKSRSKKISFKTNLAKKSASKKISIKL